jgi:hypothetical protein
MTEAAIAPPDVARRFVRPIGAILGASLAAGLLAGLYLLAESQQVESLLHVRFMFGPDGLLAFGGSVLVVLAALVGPLAAALSGWLVAPIAARGVKWVGGWMGTITFGLAIVAGCALPSLGAAIGGTESWGESILGAIVGAPMMAVPVSIILAPLLACCLMAGAAWSWAMRTFVSDPTPSSSTELERTELLGRGLLLIVGLVGLGWLVFSLMFPTMWTGGGFVD